MFHWLQCLTQEVAQWFMHIFKVWPLRGALVNLSCYNKSPQTRWFNQQIFISHSSRGWEVLFLACRWLTSHCSLTWLRERTSCLVSSAKDANPVMRTPLSWPQLNLITSKGCHLNILSHWRPELQQMDLRGGNRHSVHNKRQYLAMTYFKRTVFLCLSLLPLFHCPSPFLAFSFSTMTWKNSKEYIC